MNKLLLTVLLACAPALYAQETVRPASPQLPPGSKYYPEILQTMKNLSVLMERGGEIPPEKFEALLPDLAKFNGKVKEAVGERILAEVAAREKLLEDKSRAENSLATLRAFRGALQVFYGDSGAKYPKTPAELAPKTIPAVPELQLPGHSRTAAITVIDSKKYDKDFSKAVKDTGGWLYFSDPASENYGLLLLDCSHTGQEELKFYEY